MSSGTRAEGVGKKCNEETEKASWVEAWEKRDPTMILPLAHEQKHPKERTFLAKRALGGPHGARYKEVTQISG